MGFSCDIRYVGINYRTSFGFCVFGAIMRCDKFQKTNIRWKKDVIYLLNDLCLGALEDNFYGQRFFSRDQTRILLEILKDLVAKLPEKSRPKDLIQFEMVAEK